MAETIIPSTGPSTGKPSTTGSSLGAAAGQSSTTSPGPSADAIRSGGERMLSDARAKVIDAADAQRRRAAEAVRGMAGALHRAAGDLKPENETMGRYTDMAAERLDQFASYLRSTDWSGVVEEAEDLARRQPAWVIGGAMVAGFLLARTIKNASEPRERGDEAIRRSRRLAATSAAYGTSAQAGVFPATTATTRPMGSASGSGEV
ncbi:MAG TPA: hypothetical protein VK196_22830 [Magnetospirillum sp.]|nr:hypothetical protein [Magnetospirillum sp.]